MLQPDGSLDRRALREYIFQNPQARHTLEQITHPAIRQSIIQQLQNPKSPYVILVSPLLFETNQHELVNHTLLIDASEQTQIQRASQRDGQNQNKSRKLLLHKCHANENVSLQMTSYLMTDYLNIYISN